MVGWHQWPDGHEFDQSPGVGDWQGSLACCSPWGRKELDMTEWLNWTEPMAMVFRYIWPKVFIIGILSLRLCHSWEAAVNVSHSVLASQHLNTFPGEFPIVSLGRGDSCLLLQFVSLWFARCLSQNPLIFKLAPQFLVYNQESWLALQLQELHSEEAHLVSKPLHL